MTPYKAHSGLCKLIKNAYARLQQLGDTWDETGKMPADYDTQLAIYNNLKNKAENLDLDVDRILDLKFSGL